MEKERRRLRKKEKKRERWREREKKTESDVRRIKRYKVDREVETCWYCSVSKLMNCPGLRIYLEKEREREKDGEREKKIEKEREKERVR